MKAFIKAFLFSVATLFFIGSTEKVQAQDTTRIQTLTFDDITKRSGTWKFPEEGKSWRKILMYYTLKCDAKTQQDQFNCGEWDYLSYIDLFDSTGNLDTTTNTQYKYHFGKSTPNQIKGSDLVTSNVYSISSNQYGVHYKDSFLLKSVPVNNTQWVEIINSGNWVKQNQIELNLDATTLKSMGIDSGYISGIQLNAQQQARISRMQIFASVSNTTIQGEMAADYPVNFNAGINNLLFSQPILWDGKNELTLELKFTAPNNQKLVLAYNEAGNFSTSNYNAFDRSLHLNQGNLAEINGSTPEIKDGFTLMFWAKGGESLPKNTYTLEGLDAAGKRQFNIHLPWNNGNIYWDCGNDGSGTDRIQKSATETNYKGQWNHWAFVKNVTKGAMEIYLNGQLWHSGTNKNKTILATTRIRLGNALSNNNNEAYHGNIDKLSFWKTALTENDIQKHARTAPESKDVLYPDLIDWVDFNALSNTGFSGVKNQLNVFPSGQNMWGFNLKNASVKEDALNATPLTGIFSGTVETQPLSINFNDTLNDNHDFTIVFSDALNPLHPTELINFWNPLYQYTFENGVKIDSVANNQNLTFINETFNYEEISEIIQQVELGRFITPYGIGLDLGPDGFKWIYDVTDYASLLNGNVKLTAGNQQELIDLEFVFIEGTPARKVKNIHFLANKGNYKYGQMANDQVLQEMRIPIDASTEKVELKTRITGHGHHGETTNGRIHCCEWSDKTHQLALTEDFELIEWSIWQHKKCNLNPVINQGGNWAPPRAGWCPGAPVDDYNFDLSNNVKDGHIAFDYGIEAVPANNPNQANGNYIVSLHLFEYEKPSFALDAEIDQIIVPNNWEYYRKLNPACHEPKVVIKNSGSERLTSAKINYGVKDGNPVFLRWEGDLGFMETDTVALPFAIWDWKSASNTWDFIAEITEPNGGTDQNPSNNHAWSHFNIPGNIPTDFQIFFRNNALPGDVSFKIFNSQDEVVYEIENPEANKLYREDVHLDGGCYRLEIETIEGFGLTYPLIPQVGSGYVRFRTDKAGFVFNPDADFGQSLTHYFMTGYGLGSEKVVKSPANVKLYPNPGLDFLRLEITEGTKGEDIQLEVFSTSGKKMHMQSNQLNNKDQIIEVDCSQWTSGVYWIKTTFNGLTTTQKWVKI